MRSLRDTGSTVWRGVLKPAILQYLIDTTPRGGSQYDWEKLAPASSSCSPAITNGLFAELSSANTLCASTLVKRERPCQERTITSFCEEDLERRVIRACEGEAEGHQLETQAGVEISSTWRREGITTSTMVPGLAFARRRRPPSSVTRCRMPPIPTPTLSGRN